MNQDIPSSMTVKGQGRDRDSFRDDVIEGLSREPKSISCKYFYDDQGAQLNDLICQADDYYLARSEKEIFRQNIDEIASAVGNGSLLIEYGSGSSFKTRQLLDHLPGLAGYIPVDISAEHLHATNERLKKGYPNLSIRPLCADYTQAYTLPAGLPEARRVVFFPGSVIGQFLLTRAEKCLADIAKVCQENGGLIIGVDMKKDPRILHRAYNDDQGLTAAFNLHLLERLNRELGANFDLDQFCHYAFYNPRESRVEMHLASLANQRVSIGRKTFHFRVGETILTEHNHKYSPETFEQMAMCAGLKLECGWTDRDQLYSVYYLTVSAHVDV